MDFKPTEKRYTVDEAAKELCVPVEELVKTIRTHVVDWEEDADDKGHGSAIFHPPDLVLLRLLTTAKRVESTVQPVATQAAICAIRSRSPGCRAGAQCSAPPAVGSAASEAGGSSSRASCSHGPAHSSGRGRELRPVTGSSPSRRAIAAARVTCPSPW